MKGVKKMFEMSIHLSEGFVVFYDVGSDAGNWVTDDFMAWMGEEPKRTLFLEDILDAGYYMGIIRYSHDITDKKQEIVKWATERAIIITNL